MAEKLIKEINYGELIFLDSETCGLHGLPVLLQWAVDDGEIHLYEIWKEPIDRTLKIIRAMMDKTLIMFNARFDMFQLVKCYTVFNLFPKDWIPEEHIHEIAMREKEGRDGPCLKPKNCLDLMLHSRKGPYQSLMAREDIRIRKVPSVLADALARELEERIEIDGIYFAKSKNSARWRVYDIRDKLTNEVDPNFKDVVLKFNAAGGLKFLAEHALGYEPDAHFKDIEPEIFPAEKGWIPFATGITDDYEEWKVYDKGKLKGVAWPALIKDHIEHWNTKQDARKYARDDIKYTRELYEHFGKPEAGDNDSVLACMVAAVRWRGFRIDTEGMQELRNKAYEFVEDCPININSTREVKEYIFEVMDDTEMLIIADSANAANLKKVTSYEIEEDEECTKCFGEGCPRCDGKGKLFAGQEHPAAKRSEYILKVKKRVMEIRLYDKLIESGRFHASFNVIGTLSTRMSGADGLNAQGINHSKEVRKLFPLAWEGAHLCGGDFDSYEVTLADAVYKDPDLHKSILSGQKIHALYGMDLRPGMDYWEVIDSDGTEDDVYTMAKSGVFGMLYGGDWNTLVRNFGLKESIAREAEQRFFKRFPGIPAARQRVIDMFQSMEQPEEGGQVFWSEPCDYIESFLGFRRYYTLENKICRALFELAKNVPTEWHNIDMTCFRRKHKGEQKVSGAVASALYATAFGMQGQNVRSAANHEIQSPGGQICKAVQRKVWDLQPHGVNEMRVAPMNVHDELMVVIENEKDKEVVADVVEESVVSFRDKVPLIGMKWNLEMANWAEKKGGAETRRIEPDQMREGRHKRLHEAFEELKKEFNGAVSSNEDDMFFLDNSNIPESVLDKKLPFKGKGKKKEYRYGEFPVILEAA